MELTFEYLKEHKDDYKIYVPDYTGAREDKWNFVWGYWECASEDEAKKYNEMHTKIYAISPYLRNDGNIANNYVITGFLILDYKENIGFTSAQKFFGEEHVCYGAYKDADYWRFPEGSNGIFKMFDSYEEATAALKVWLSDNKDNSKNKRIKSLEKKIKAEEDKLANLRKKLDKLKNE